MEISSSAVVDRRRSSAYPLGRLLIGIAVVTLLGVLWGIYIAVELERVRNRTIGALEQGDANVLFGLISREEREALHVTPEAIRHALAKSGFSGVPRKMSGPARLWVEATDNPSVVRSDWVVVWKDLKGNPIPSPATLNRIVDPLTGVARETDFSILTFNKPAGWRYYLLPGWHFNFTAFVSGLYVMQDPEGLRPQELRATLEGEGIPGYLGVNGVLRRFPETP